MLPFGFFYVWKDSGSLWVFHSFAAWLSVVCALCLTSQCLMSEPRAAECRTACRTSLAARVLTAALFYGVWAHKDPLNRS